MVEERKKEFKFRLADEEEVRMLKKALFLADEHRQHIGHALVMGWVRSVLDGETPKIEGAEKPRQPAKSSYPEANREWHDLLEIILADPEQRVGIEWNLKWGASHIAKGTPPNHTTQHVWPPRKRASGE